LQLLTKWAIQNLYKGAFLTDQGKKIILFESSSEKTDILFRHMQKVPCLLEENSRAGEKTVTSSLNICPKFLLWKGMGARGIILPHISSPYSQLNSYLTTM
jgi:hypothetical protein